ncbi:poly-beta-1,6-N-acetyl-D-glucosamine synthase [Saccharicrinis fermentans DSM 9555 = JCM 21142]|uniref:Poly-beta-1,6-N-acetyl-D-glucosamine synthase n=1 Tax=Saccharicrinis fermentans DSM 9555 = JCM 21142 TaxID=869213 RepID=W7YJ27_9BACT|nr:poly-beta-1,6-N-acetyl-D-glucosamine synthase [Saccharicrinis fermentans DSM 9555 = JCM 21142]
MLCAFFVQMFYYLYFYLALGKYLKNDQGESNFSYPPVSVIICAKNESKNLEKHLPAVLEQEYSAPFQVIVVNDASEDTSELVLARLKERYANLYFTSIPYDKKFRHGKKLALTLGVKAAKYEHLLFTDADCEPVDKYWIKEMVQGFSLGKDIVLGYGPYKKQKGFINLWQRYDTFQIAIQYLSFALRGIPYMAVGRNMAYKKSLFYNNQGFKSHQHILSGDDDLFIRDAANKNNVAIVALLHSQTRSVPVKSFKEWKRQKKRHLTTAPYYRFKTKVLLGVEALSRQLLWCISLMSVFFSNFEVFFITIIIVKLAVQYFIQRKIARQIETTELAWGGLLLDFILPLVTGLLLISGKRQANRNKWT